MSRRQTSLLSNPFHVTDLGEGDGVRALYTSLAADVRDMGFLFDALPQWFGVLQPLKNAQCSGHWYYLMKVSSGLRRWSYLVCAKANQMLLAVWILG